MSERWAEPSGGGALPSTLRKGLVAGRPGRGREGAGPDRQRFRAILRAWMSTHSNQGGGTLPARRCPNESPYTEGLRTIELNSLSALGAGFQNPASELLGKPFLHPSSAWWPQARPGCGSSPRSCLCHHIPPPSVCLSSSQKDPAIGFRAHPRPDMTSSQGP